MSNRISVDCGKKEVRESTSVGILPKIVKIAKE